MTTMPNRWSQRRRTPRVCLRAFLFSLFLSPAWLLVVRRHTMRIPLFFALMVFFPILALGDAQWHEFGRSRDKDTITIGRTILTVEVQTNADSGFPGDDLILT